MMSPCDAARLSTLLQVYSVGFHDIISEVGNATSYPTQLTALLWRLFSYLLDQCQPDCDFELEISALIRDNEDRRCQCYRQFELDQAALSSRENSARIRLNHVYEQAGQISAQYRQVLSRLQTANELVVKELIISNRLLERNASLQLEVNATQSEALNHSTKYQNRKRDISQQCETISILKGQISETTIASIRAGRRADLDRLKIKVGAMQGAMQRMVAHHTMVKSMLANGAKSLADFRADVVALDERIVILNEECEQAQRLTKDAIEWREQVAQQLSDAEALGLRLKKDDDRFTCVAVAAETEQERIRNDVEKGEEREMEMRADLNLTQNMIGMMKEVPEGVEDEIERVRGEVRRKGRAVERAGEEMERWIERNNEGKMRVREMEGQVKGIRERIREFEEGIERVSGGLTPEMEGRVRRVIKAREEQERALERLREGRRREGRNREVIRERRMMAIEDTRSHIQIVYGVVTRNMATQDGYREVMDQETRNIEQCQRRAEELAIEIEQAQDIMKQEKEAQNIIMARDRERQRQRTDLLSKLTTGTSAMRRAKDDIDRVQVEIQELNTESDDAISLLERQRVAGEGRLRDLAAKRDEMDQEHNMARIKSDSSIDGLRAQSLIRHQQMTEKRQTQYDLLVDRSGLIRLIEFVYRNLEHGVLESRRIAIELIESGERIGKAIGEECVRLSAHQLAINECRLSAQHTQTEIAKQTLTFGLRRHAMIADCQRNAALRRQICRAVNSRLPIDLRLGQIISQRYNRSMTTFGSTQTKVDTAQAQTQTDDDIL